MFLQKTDPTTIFSLIVIGGVTAVCYTVFYRLYLHPLAKFPGPWYSRVSSIPLALLSIEVRIFNPFLFGVHIKLIFAGESAIRIKPDTIFLPKPSALREIYWDPKCNEKAGMYSHGGFGPPSLFTTLSSVEHKPLRKALGAAPWSIGSLKVDWEPRIDDQIQLFISKMTEQAKANAAVVLCDKLEQFAADIMTTFTFNEPWGFVENSRDERGLLASFRRDLDFIGWSQRFTFFRDYVMKLPGLAGLLIPKPEIHSGMGYLIKEAEQAREGTFAGIVSEKPDFLQHCLDARMDGHPLSRQQKQNHVTLLIQAGADSTGTLLGSTMRFLTVTPGALDKARKELSAAESSNLLSALVKYEETRTHLPFIAASIKETIRLNPPFPNWFARIVQPEGKTIDGIYIPGGVDITSNAYTVQRDRDLYAPDPDSFRPERWLVEGKEAEYDAATYAFGMGPRVCLGKDFAIMETFKLIPEIIRRFDIEVLNPGKWVVVGGISYNRDFVVKLRARD
ncbi:cytochrome p450 17a1 protein [Rutstroemia sp. NJR-2017a BVV2]|nr:cytochrome p450 17a1 protein [Rutstroemia sp. NJR-2017a BVV2]